MTHSFSALIMALPAMLFLGACGESLVFTEKTGFNVAVSVDAAQGSPVETNLGLHRRVAGMVPPIRRKEDGRSDAEAANLVGGFQVVQDPDSSNVFNTTVKVASGYATGPAALKLVGDLPAGETNQALRKNEDETIAAVKSVMRPAQAASASENTTRLSNEAKAIQKVCSDVNRTFVLRENSSGKLEGACE